MKRRDGYGRVFVLLAIVISVWTITSFNSALYASDYPNRPIALVVGSSPGGGFDLQGRLFCKYWPKYLPREVPMIVRNITGGGGIRSANQIWIAPPDGYTIIQLKTGPYILSENLHPSLVKFKMKEWQYICGRYTYNISVLIARAEIAEKIKNYEDLVNYSKKKPLSFATGGVGSSMHTKQLVVSEASEIPMKYVHFPGSMQAFASLLRGEVDFTITAGTTAVKQDLKAMPILLSFNDDKGRFASVAPTAIEFGFPKEVMQKINSNLVFVAPRSFAVPAKTPKNVVKVLRDSFWELVTSKEFNQAVEKVGHFLEPIKAEDFEKDLPSMYSDIEKFAPSLKAHFK